MTMVMFTKKLFVKLYTHV